MKRHYGEEAQKVSKKDQAIYDARIAEMQAGTYDFDSIIEDTPVVVICIKRD